MASARKAADTEFKKEFNVTFKQAQTYIQGDKKKDKFTKRKDKQQDQSKVILK